jgi:hypothetical protein
MNAEGNGQEKTKDTNLTDWHRTKTNLNFRHVKLKFYFMQF